jgi:hypothetical protein
MSFKQNVRVLGREKAQGLALLFLSQSTTGTGLLLNVLGETEADVVGSANGDEPVPIR